MADIPIWHLDPKAQPPSKPYRGHPTLTVRGYGSMTHAEQMAVDKDRDEALGIKYEKQQGLGPGQTVLVGKRPE